MLHGGFRPVLKARRQAALLTVFALVITLVPLLAAPAAAQDDTLGIDVSHHQGTINWTKVAESGHVFAFHKATEGVGFYDRQYETNRGKAANVSIPFGAYHFARPSGETISAAEADAVSEADYFLEIAKPAPGDMLPVLDLEATGGLPVNRMVAWTQAWLDEVTSELDVQPLVYTSPSFWEGSLGNTTTFAEQGFPLWVAHYTDAAAPRTPGSNWNGESWAFWQYSSCATVPGISGCADHNRFSGSDLSQYTIPGAPVPEPTPDEATPPSNDSPPEISGDSEVGSRLTASTGTWSGSQPQSYSYGWRRCDEDGSGCTAVLNGTRPEYRLSPADFGHRMRVTVTATNSAGSSSADSKLSDVVTDTTAPVAPRVVKPVKPQTLKPRLNVEWARAEEDARYDVRVRKTSDAGKFGSHQELVSGTTDTTAKLRPVRGATYCFSARATDTAGNTSGWSNERCTVAPLDDRDLRAAKGWKRASARAFYLRTSTKSARRGAKLTARNVAVREIFLVAQVCPDCGKVAVFLDGKRVGSVNLEADSTSNKQVLRVARFTSVRRGDIKLRISSKWAPVRIDGLVLAVR